MVSEYGPRDRRLDRRREIRWISSPQPRCPSNNICLSTSSVIEPYVAYLKDFEPAVAGFAASCRAPQSTCRKDSLPLRRLESTTMSDSGRLRLSAQVVNLEQWCILG